MDQCRSIYDINSEVDLSLKFTGPGQPGFVLERHFRSLGCKEWNLFLKADLEDTKEEEDTNEQEETDCKQQDTNQDTNQQEQEQDVDTNQQQEQQQTKQQRREQQRQLDVLLGEERLSCADDAIDLPLPLWEKILATYVIVWLVVSYRLVLFYVLYILVVSFSYCVCGSTIVLC